MSFRSLPDQFYSGPGMEKEGKVENKLFSIKSPSEISAKIVGLSNECSIIKNFLDVQNFLSYDRKYIFTTV